MRNEVFSAALAEARQTLTQNSHGTLSVIDFETGGPFGSFVNFATGRQGYPLLLLSGLARHTKCITADSRASLLVCDSLPAKGDPLTASRITITGRMEKSQAPEYAERYLARHPYSEMYLGFSDFHFWILNPEKIFLVGGFGKIFSFSAHEFFQ
jgi:heme iron utilization protein